MNTKEKIAVMQAAVDGKVVQCRLQSCDLDPPPWRTGVDSEVNWNWGLFEYRIKPEPMEIYINIYASGSIVPYNEKIMAENARRSGTALRTVKFIEVIEED